MRPEDTSVSIAAALDDSVIRITVRDHGSGIPTAYLDKVFERFFQVPKDGRGSEGFGLGLAIASSVAQLHRGGVRANNEATGGCAFEVTLPLRRQT